MDLLTSNIIDENKWKAFISNLGSSKLENILNQLKYSSLFPETKHKIFQIIKSTKNDGFIANFENEFILETNTSVSKKELVISQGKFAGFLFSEAVDTIRKCFENISFQLLAEILFLSEDFIEENIKNVQIDRRNRIIYFSRRTKSEIWNQQIQNICRKIDL